MFIFAIIGKLWKVLSAGFWTVIGLAIALNFLFGTAFYYAERHVQEGLTWIDSLWWSMVTMTTVGYGDFYAQTFVGRFLISYPCMVIGIGIIGYLVGLVANIMIEWASKKRKGEMGVSYENHIIICNFPGVEKVRTIVNEFRVTPQYKDTRMVLVTEMLEELPDGLRKDRIDFVKGCPTDEDVLFRANILKCAGVIVLTEDPTNIRSDDRTFAIGAIIESIEEERKTDIKTITELIGRRGMRNMKRMTVDGMVASEGMTGCLLVQEFMYPGVNSLFNQIISNTVGSQIYIHDTKLKDISIVELQTRVLRHEANIQVIGLMRGEKQILNPDKQMTIQAGDKLIVLAENQHDLGAIEQDILN